MQNIRIYTICTDEKGNIFGDIINPNNLKDNPYSGSVRFRKDERGTLTVHSVRVNFRTIKENKEIKIKSAQNGFVIYSDKDSTIHKEIYEVNSKIEELFYLYNPENLDLKGLEFDNLEEKMNEYYTENQ